MIGNWTTLRSSGCSDNAELRLRADSVVFQIGNNISSEPIPGNNNRPNHECDKVGTNNASWTVNGTVPMVSGLRYSDGLGMAGNEVSISGLMTFWLTGSKIWFYDEALTIKARIVNNQLLVTTSGTWVEVNSLNLGRTPDYTDAGHEVGYMLPYTLVLTETT